MRFNNNLDFDLLSWWQAKTIYVANRHVLWIWVMFFLRNTCDIIYSRAKNIHEFWFLYFLKSIDKTRVFFFFRLGTFVKNRETHVFLWNCSVCTGFSELLLSLKLHQTCHCWEMFQMTECLPVTSQLFSSDDSCSAVTTAIQWRQLLSDDSCSVTTFIQWAESCSVTTSSQWPEKLGLAHHTSSVYDHCYSVTKNHRSFSWAKPVCSVTTANQWPELHSLFYRCP